MSRVIKHFTIDRYHVQERRIDHIVYGDRGGRVEFDEWRTVATFYAEVSATSDAYDRHELSSDCEFRVVDMEADSDVVVTR